VLSSHRPEIGEGASGDTFAAVAIVLSGAAADPSVLFIERAMRAGDPWSGHMAFPGGRVDDDDESIRFTAERETHEEVGLDLSSAECLGRLDYQGGRRAGAASGVLIASFVYHLESPGALLPNHEVEEAMWVRFSDLLDPANKVDYPYRGQGGPFDGIVVGHPQRHIVWGLTRRILRSLLELMGEPLP
jgi:8-oxo-dGTP pyrophosphatase MutT (NUDIX family)